MIVITRGEVRYILDVLTELDVEIGEVDECIELLAALLDRDDRLLEIIDEEVSS